MLIRTLMDEKKTEKQSHWEITLKRNHKNNNNFIQKGP